jgi:flagellar biosynthesis protein FlhF
MSSTDKQKNLVAGKKFRFVVSSAAEAVKVVKERLGDNARVLKVEQIGGTGLAAFFSKPQLEIIAAIPTQAELDREAKEVQAKINNAKAVKNPQPKQPVVPQAPVPESIKTTPQQPTTTGRQIYRKNATQVQPQTIKEEVIGGATANKQRENNVPLTPSGKETLNTLLAKANFDSDLIHQIEISTSWDQISNMKLEHGISEVFLWLREQYNTLKPQPLATRIAFLGTPGCGKTTALCKRLTNEVFVKGKKIQVLKVENDIPNPDDSLRVLCDILGIELLRDPMDLSKVDVGGDLYLDVPGVPLRNHEQWLALNKRLDELWVTTRVLVLNSAYESAVIKDTIALADKMKCTHMVFTHLDELSNITKLWPLILNSRLSTLFFSYGQNVTSEFTDDVLEYMTKETFPSYLTN